MNNRKYGTFFLLIQNPSFQVYRYIMCMYEINSDIYIYIYIYIEFILICLRRHSAHDD